MPIEQKGGLNGCPPSPPGVPASIAGRGGAKAQPMAITRETVLHVARLARLELEGDEVERMQRDLGNILGYIEQLGELATEGIPATAHVATESAPLRPDQVVPGLDQERALAEAPRKGGGSFAVPGFVDE